MGSARAFMNERPVPRSDSVFKAGFAEKDITPESPVHLAGYFNDRVAAETLDPLYVKAAVFDDGRCRTGQAVVDLCLLPRNYITQAREQIARDTGLDPRHVLISATHTHTAPAPRSLFDVPEEANYMRDTVVQSIVQALNTAESRLEPCELSVGSIQEQGLAFCRRYWMAEGRVVTNPPKGSPEIVRPESEVDHTVTVMRFHRGEQTLGLLVNINNHCDTTGGSRVSADWPGHMAALVSGELGRAVSVILLYGLSGNVNHFDPQLPSPQTSPSEARRVGRAYGRFVLQALEQAVPVGPEPIGAARVVFRAPYRTVGSEQLSAAKTLLAEHIEHTGGDLTAEDLARGNRTVERLFARMLVEFHERYAGKDDEELEISATRLGELALLGLPGEPFSQIGVRIKQASPFGTTCVMGLTGGAAGYIPLEEHFLNGGYEIRTTPCNRFQEHTGSAFVSQAGRCLQELFAAGAEE